MISLIESLDNHHVQGLTKNIFYDKVYYLLPHSCHRCWVTSRWVSMPFALILNFRTITQIQLSTFFSNVDMWSLAECPRCFNRHCILRTYVLVAVLMQNCLIQGFFIGKNCSQINCPLNAHFGSRFIGKQENHM